MTQRDIVLAILKRQGNPTSGEIEDLSIKLYRKRVRGVTQRISDLRKEGAIIKALSREEGTRFVLVKLPNKKEVKTLAKVSRFDTVSDYVGGNID